MRDLIEIIKDVERELVINLTISQRRNRIDGKIAREIAKRYMQEYPYKSKKELFEKLYEMSVIYKEVRKVYLKYVFEYEDEKTKKSLKEMRNYMKINDFESAIKTAKGGD